MNSSETWGPDEAVLDKDIQHFCASEDFSPYVVFRTFPHLQWFQSASGALPAWRSEAVHASGLQFSPSGYDSGYDSLWAKQFLL